MQIEIDENELREWAINKIKNRMGEKINTLIREWGWEWKSYIRDVVDDVVKEKVTDEVIKSVIGNMDKDGLIKTVSGSIAEEIADKLQNS